MRFDVAAAFAIGLLLPVLETARRGILYWTVDFTTMFEDYVAGSLLLIGAWGAHRARRWGVSFLLLAWAYYCGLMGSSFWYQVEETLRGQATEPDNFLVVAVKLLLWGIGLAGLILSLRRAREA